MKRMLVALFLAVTVVGPAHAQMAGAIGKPLPSPDLPPGTVSVRVVAGSNSNNVIGTDVTLLVNGAPRVARTDSAGRAHFKDLPAGAQVQAKALDDDKKEVASEAFQLPADMGARVMLTTRPWNPGASATPPPGGAAGPMANPRQMSGEARPEANDAPGTLTVRLTYDDFKDAPPVDVAVALVGYNANGSVTFTVRKSDAEGRAKFEGLDRTGATSYFAMTQLARGTTIDRLATAPITLDPRSGSRVILSSEKRTSTAAALDDLSRFDKQDGAPPAGIVRVALEGSPEADGVVTLVDAESKVVIGRGKSADGAPDATDIQAGAQFDDSPDIAPGMVRVRVQGGPAGSDMQPLPDVAVRLILASAQDAGSDANDHKTNASGIVELANPAQEPLTAVITINGKQLRSKPFELTKTGGELVVQAQWPNRGRPEATFDLVPRPGQVVYAETIMRGNQYRSLPFQPVADRGTRITLFVYPRLMFTFSLTSRVDDEYLAVNGRFELSNFSWAPYVGGPDGLLIPLPKGFTGGLVAEKDQGDVALTPGEGFRISRPIPPGMRAFHGAFSLPAHNGTVKWAMDLPYGAFNSGMEILSVPGMTVKTPPGVEGQTVTVPQGTFFALPRIDILPKQAMVLRIDGLPAPPAWRVWIPRVVGVLVVLLMLGGLVYALFMRRPEAVARSERRQQLLEELVELQKTNQNEKRREQIMTELEQLWDDTAG